MSVLRATHGSDASPEVLFSRAIGFMASGVAVLSSAGVTMTVSTLHGVSFDPPWISVSLERRSRKAGLIIDAGSFSARILRADEETLTRADAMPASFGLADLACSIASVQVVGDHNLVLAEVMSADIRDGNPLLYWRRGLHSSFTPRYAFLDTRETFRRFVETWEAGRLTRSEWTHAAHVAMGACYATQYGPAALERLRQGIRRHNAAVGTLDSETSGYHETLTRFWLGLVAPLVSDSTDPWLAASNAVERFGEERDLHRLYYSFDVVRDVNARALWIPPDRDPAF